MQDIFVDGINNIYITGNLVRIELANLEPQMKTEDGQPVYNVKQRVVMPLDAFVSAFTLQNDIMQQLIQAGVVNFTPAQQSGLADSQSQ